MAPKTVSSLTEYLEAIEEITNQKWHRASSLFYRGVTDNSYNLCPSVFRAPIKTPQERQFLFEFRMKAPMHGIEHPTEAIALWLTDMQHYGVPTRLLDWSLSPLTALFFATYNCKTDSNAAVHILNPQMLLRFSREKADVSWLNVDSRNVSSRARLIIDSTSQVKKRAEYRGVKLDGPVPFFAKHSNNRIIAQGGCFTIHGADKTPIDLINRAVAVKDKTITRNDFHTRIDINSSSKERICSELRKLNINEHSLFPDLYGLAEKMKHRTM